METKHIFGIITITVIIGGTIYAIKKHKDLEKEEGDAISLEEAMRIVNSRNSCDEISDLPFEVIETTTNEPVRNVRSIRLNHFDLEDEEEVTEDVHDSFEINDELYKDEEEMDMRCDPNSADALHQYKKMELSEWVVGSDTYQTMMRLYEFPFRPRNTGDEILRSNLVDRRVRFFGYESRWSTEVTYGDLIMHYAKLANFNCDESVEYWVEQFLDNVDIYHGYSSKAIDDVLDSLNTHTYYNEQRNTFGLFGLSQSYMNSAIEIGNRGFDGCVTYENEFNELLKSLM